MLDMLAKLLKALNAEGSPTQISLGFAAGLIVGLTPLWSLHNVLLVFLVFLLRINLSAFFLSFAVFSEKRIIDFVCRQCCGNWQIPGAQPL